MDYRATNRMQRLALSALLLLAGCSAFGPTTIPRDRFDYSGALSESWKTQMLLNLVKMRYFDLPVYLEVGQIVSGYTLETSANVGGEVGNVAAGTNFLDLGVSGRYTDRPTITYSPQTGQKFLESFLTPIHPAKILSLVQAGFAADFILRLGVESLNGLRNDPVNVGSTHKADPQFLRVLVLLREIQDAGAVGLKVDEPQGNKPATVLFFRRERIPPEVRAKIEEARSLLGLSPGQFNFRLVSSPLKGGPGELSLATRSLAQVMAALAFGIEIPPAHVRRRLTPPLTALEPGKEALLKVHSGPDKPADAYVAVPYEGAWFWIAHDDWRSKRTFSSILFLFTLADTGGKGQQPVLTIPTQ